MSDSDSKFYVPDILSQPTRWDQLIAIGLSAEVEALLVEKIDITPELRQFLAIKGYRELHQRLETAVNERTGEAALRAVAFEMRAYAHDRPGLSADSRRAFQT